MESSSALKILSEKWGKESENLNSDLERSQGGNKTREKANAQKLCKYSTPSFFHYWKSAHFLDEMVYLLLTICQTAAQKYQP